MARSRRLLAAVLALAVVLAPVRSSAQVDIRYTKYTLQNGMTVILHEDRSLPLVAVNLTFLVGSRHEEPGRTGFAHLFEHLMFMGTARAPIKMFDAWMEAEGAWNNAWTSEDRTDYFEIGPSRTLALLLWLEADRLSSLGGQMTKEKLDAQRDVVRNERRQSYENAPYGKVELRLPELLWPEGHPYHHPVIGSHKDLEAATVEDVRAFFARHYAPDNASLVVAGDIDPAEVRALVERYFSWIPRGPSRPRPAPPPPAPLRGTVRETISDQVELGKVVMAWRSAPRFAPGDADLDLAAAILSEGKASRLYKALVYDTALAQEVGARQESGDLGSRFVVEAVARPGVPLANLEAAIEKVLDGLRGAPVLPAELRRVQNQYETSFVARLQSIAERASILNDYEATRGDPGFAERDLDRYRKVTTASLLGRVRETLRPDARVVLHVVPAKAGATPPPPAGGGR